MLVSGPFWPTNCLTLANLFAGGFVIGQYLSDRPVSITMVLLGILMWLTALAAALLVARGER